MKYWQSSNFLLTLTIILSACQPPSAEAQGFTVHVHPDGPLFVGDLISFEVIPPVDFDTTDQEVVIYVEDSEMGRARFELWGVGQRPQATFWWVWDTEKLSPETYILTFSVMPADLTWNKTIRLRPQEGIPPPEPEAEWTSTTTDCCIIYTISGTDADRDLPTLIEMVEYQVDEVETSVGTAFDGTISVTFLPRTLGHGGFASDGIYISYLDANYAGGSTSQILHHEMVHILDAQVGGGVRPPIFIEGLAVYLSGGHFKPEPILERAAALLSLGLYIPLLILAEDFYKHQHDNGYLEAAALVEYLIHIHGWERFDAFYRDIPQHTSGEITKAIDTAMQKHFSISFDDLETDFIEYLRSQTVSQATIADLQLTVEFYDTVRRYQSLLDPSAYFLYAWMPTTSMLMERDVVADYLRHSHGWHQRFIEYLLHHSGRSLFTGEYNQTGFLIDLTNAILDLIE